MPAPRCYRCWRVHKGVMSLFGRRLGRGGPVAVVLRWLVRALGLGFILGAAVGARSACRGGEVDGHAIVDRLERALRVLAGREGDGASEGSGDGHGSGAEGPA